MNEGVESGGHGDLNMKAAWLHAMGDTLGSVSLQFFLRRELTKIRIQMFSPYQTI